MKKRTLKKWIPKDTIYCYYNGKYHGRSGQCRFYTENRDEIKDYWYKDGYCKLLNVSISDMCKACNINRSGWFKVTDYSGCSSHYFKREREWSKKYKSVDTLDFV